MERGLLGGARRDGFQGLQLARRGQPEAILLDVVPTGIDGFQLCRTLRRKSTAPITKEAGQLEGMVQLSTSTAQLYPDEILEQISSECTI